MHGWTKVADKLPPEETPVLLLVSGTVYEGSLEWERPGFEDSFAAFQYFVDTNNDFDWEWWDVTHWMVLPELPSEEEMTPADHPASAPEPIDWIAQPETIYGTGKP